jgi:hypothetical protein
MYIPCTRERVLVADRHAIFLVIAIDQNQQTADLIPLIGKAFALESVPFAAIFPFREESPMEAA